MFGHRQIDHVVCETHNDSTPHQRVAERHDGDGRFRRGFKFPTDSEFVPKHIFCFTVFRRSPAGNALTSTALRGKSESHSSNLVIRSRFNHRPGEDNELTKAENGSQRADKMFSPARRNKGLQKPWACTTTRPTGDVIRKVGRQNRKSMKASPSAPRCLRGYFESFGRTVTQNRKK